MEKSTLDGFSRQKKLQAWLDEQGLTRRALARWINIDPSLLTHVMAGKRNCTEPVYRNLESVGFPLEIIPRADFKTATHKKEQ
jgi:predicted transcriptional regulator